MARTTHIVHHVLRLRHHLHVFSRVSPPDLVYSAYLGVPQVHRQDRPITVKEGMQVLLNLHNSSNRMTQNASLSHADMLERGECLALHATTFCKLECRLGCKKVERPRAARDVPVLVQPRCPVKPLLCSQTRQPQIISAAQQWRRSLRT